MIALAFALLALGLGEPHCPEAERAIWVKLGERVRVRVLPEYLH